MVQQQYRECTHTRPTFTEYINTFKAFNDPDMQLFLQALQDGLFNNHLGRIAVVIDSKFVPLTFERVDDIVNSDDYTGGTLFFIPCSNK